VFNVTFACCRILSFLPVSQYSVKYFEKNAIKKKKKSVLKYEECKVQANVDLR
jgi:hypothetical protein